MIATAAVFVHHDAVGGCVFDDDFQWLGGSLSFRPASPVDITASSLFATENIRSFSERTEADRDYAIRFRHIHGDLPSDSRVRPDQRLHINHERRFVTALVQ